MKVMDSGVWIPPDTDLSIADPDITRLGHGVLALTPPQVRVLMMLSEGLPNARIRHPAKAQRRKLDTSGDRGLKK